MTRSPLSRCCVLLCGLASLTAAAQAQAPKQIVLTGKSPERVHDLRVAPGSLMSIWFDSAIDPSSVELKPMGQGPQVSPSERAIVVRTQKALGSGVRVPLSLRFKDGTKAAFELIDDSARPDLQVEVYRYLEPRQEPESQQADCPGGTPLAAVASGFLDKGFRMQRTKFLVLPDNQGRLGASAIQIFKGHMWQIISMDIQNLADHKSLTPSSVEVADKQGRRVKVLSVSMTQIEPRDEGRVAIEIEPTELEMPFRLELKDATGLCLLSVGGIIPMDSQQQE